MESPLERLQQSAWKEILEFVHTYNDRLVVEMLAKRIFHDSMPKLDREKKPMINEMEDFAYALIAPLVLGFMKWFLEEIQNSDYDKILFSTRDGYFIQKLYNQMVKKNNMKNMPLDEYFPISRTLCVAAAVFTEEDIINYARVKYAKGPEAMLKRRFGVAEKDIIPYDNDKNKNIVEYALLHSEKILESSKRIRDNYVRYMERSGLEKEKRYGLFDFVSSGTCQLLLGHIAELDIEGLYVCRYYPFQGITNYTNAEEKRELPIKAYVVNRSTTEKETYFFKNYNFLELIFTSMEPSVVSMDEKGPILDHEERSTKDLENICIVQKAIKQYMDDIGELLLWDDDISFPLIDKILSLKESAYTRLECEYLNNCELIEDFGQGRIKVR